MFAKRFGVFVLCMLAWAGNAVAKMPQADTDITVSKNSEHFAMFPTVQAAVNAASPGNIIEILDEAIYDEQVTIDGRETSPWPGVTGGKHGITIRYVPPAGTPVHSNHARPTIRHRDMANTSPRTVAEARTSGDMPGSSGNFETSGALRVIRARGVVIDGIAVDGGGPFPFGASGVWCPPQGGQCSHLFHGNAAITLAIAGNTTIRNCVLTNAYFGINVKDRNTGGVFGNPNPADNEYIVPLAGFGNVGNHLIEYNRIHRNSVGIFFESAWDLGSTVRYNLIYMNHHTPATWNALGSVPGDSRDNNNGGAILFKDMTLSPVAIYNNTFFDNAHNFLGHWQIGGQHLIFNNIFSRRNGGAQGGVTYMLIDNLFPNRMSHSVMSSMLPNEFQIQCQSNFDCIPQHEAVQPGGCFVADVRLNNNFQNPVRTTATFNTCNTPGGPPNQQTQQQQIVAAGAIIPGGTGAGRGFPAGANVRWLQTEGGTFRGHSGSPVILPPLFKSLEESSPDFLVPDWDHLYVSNFIRQQGWPAGTGAARGAGIRNSDGTFADLGARPQTGRPQSTVARLRPTGVVTVSGTTANAMVSLNVERGAFNNPRISFLRWISPIPENRNTWANEFTIIGPTAVQSLSAVNALEIGTNRFQFTLPAALTAAHIYGFFEIVVEGTDAAGNTVTSDVGFLPYRQLEYFLDIEFYELGANIVPSNMLTQVVAGQDVQMVIRARAVGQMPPGFNNTMKELSFSLLSDATAELICTQQCGTSAVGGPLSLDENVNLLQRIYQVHFQRAGQETVQSSGVWESGANRLVFLGNRDITVRPGEPDRVIFRRPIPHVEGATPPTIRRGQDYSVQVEVQDRFGNSVDVSVEVAIENNEPAIGGIINAGGNIASTTARTVVSTDPDSMGRAFFTARVAEAGAPQAIFRMTATINQGNHRESVGALRVGNPIDFVQIFYSDNGPGIEWREYYDPDVVIEGMVGNWYEVTAKVVNNTEVLTSWSGYGVKVRSDNSYLLMSLTEGGDGVSELVVPATGGVATFWIYAPSSIPDDIANATLYVDAMRTAADVDVGIIQGSRSGIWIHKVTSNILYAVVYGDGHGRPDSLIIHYSNSGGGNGFDGDIPVPNAVSLDWPVVEASGGVSARVDGTRVSATGPFTLKADFRGVIINSVVGLMPAGHTSVSGSGMSLARVYTGEQVDFMFQVFDGIGPIVADLEDGIDGRISPMMVENLTGEADTLIVQLTEPIRGVEGLFVGTNYILYTTDANNPATGGTSLTIASAGLDFTAGAGENTYKLVLAPGSPVPVEGNWIRINPASGITDFATRTIGEITHPDNGVHPENRWVKLELRTLPPEITSAYYTSNALGILNYAYITFNKPVTNIASWFTGGYFAFQSPVFGQVWDSISVTATSDFITVMPGDTTIRVALDVAHPRSQAGIMTSGSMNVSMGFSAGMQWPEIKSRPIDDRAAPVLADTVYLKLGAVRADGTPHPDTLIVTYSEAIEILPHIPSVATNPNWEEVPFMGARPLVIMNIAGQELFSPEVAFLSQSLAGNYTRVIYLIRPGSLDIESLGANEFVRINELAHQTDAITPPNEQTDPDNRRQPLKLDRGSIDYRVTVGPNPFNERITLIVRPGARTSDMDITSYIRIFNKLGNLVKDTVVMAESQASLTWEWDGRNRKRRMVGTGTYLLCVRTETRFKGPGGNTEQLRREDVDNRRIPIMFIRRGQ